MDIMKDKRKFTILLILVLAVLTVCLAPWPQKVDCTLNAVRLDADGNEIGTAQISIKGHRLVYLFRNPRMDVSISPFDDYSGFQASVNSNNHMAGQIYTIMEQDIQMVNYGVWHSSAQVLTPCTLRFSPDMDRWMICIYHDSGENVYYVGSVAQNYTTAQLAAYFGIPMEP